ncbi:MAG: hypothetical protein IJX38_02050 [Clostridia bacterium]|nr:hypothetical protein [Clostridia bacterium]
MKKLISLILVFILIFTLVGCAGGAEEDPGSNEPGDNTPGTGDTPGTDETPGDDKPGTDTPGTDTPGDDKPEEEGRTFTVSFVLDGETFIPPTPLTVVWTGDQSNGTYGTYSAVTDENGVATAKGLDGDYLITIENLPAAYTYNPNGNTTSNGNPNKYIEIYEIDYPLSTNRGTDYYEDVIPLDQTGEYRVVVRSATPTYFQFVPLNSGTYYIESWVSVTDNTVNPIAHYHEGSVAFKNERPIIVNTGGAEGTYTKNFKYSMNVGSSNISANGSVVFCFGIFAELNEGDYPVTIDFVLRYENTYQPPSYDKPFIVPQELPKTSEEFSEWYNTHDSYTTDPIDISSRYCTFVRTLSNGKRIFDGTKVKYNNEDGFYHLFDETAYPDTDGYGPIIYAKITAPIFLLTGPGYEEGTPFTQVENSSPALTLSNGTENYKIFIEGLSAVAEAGFLCTSDCPCHKNGSGRFCYDGCASCTADCTKIPAMTSYQAMGYAGLANSDGLCPVTEELKDFLMKYNAKHFLFKDGYGVAELEGYNSYEGDQWLFACCYYG